MRRVLQWFVLNFLILCTACAFKPDMGAAMSDQYMAGWDVGSTTDLDRVEAELESMGFRVMERTDGLKRLTTLPDKVLYPEGFRKQSKRHQVEKLRHELAHAKQWQALGVYLFGAKYAHESGRWVLEMHGMRQQVRDACDNGTPHEDIAQWVEAESKSFPKRYLFTPKNHHRVSKATAEALTAELQACES